MVATKTCQKREINAVKSQSAFSRITETAQLVESLYKTQK